MNSKDRGADKSAASPERQEQDAREDALDEKGELPRDDDNGQVSENGDAAGHAPRSPLFSLDERQEAVGEQEEFRQQFDEDLYIDREDKPAQSNTAGIADDDEQA